MTNSKCSRALLAGILASSVLAVTGIPQSASAATITDLLAVWPTSPDVQTVDAINNSPANRGIAGTRIDQQSFTVDSDVTVGTIYLSAANYNNLAFTISFYETVGGVNDNPPVPGTQVGSTITVDPFGSTSSGNGNMEISLSPSEQFTLPALTGGSGYMMAVQLVDTSSSTAGFNWVHSNSGTDIYTGGRYLRDDGNTTNTRDFGLALVAAPVPEPGSLALLAIGSSLLLAVRRRRQAR